MDVERLLLSLVLDAGTCGTVILYFAETVCITDSSYSRYKNGVYKVGTKTVCITNSITYSSCSRYKKICAI